MEVKEINIFILSLKNGTIKRIGVIKTINHLFLQFYLCIQIHVQQEHHDRCR